MPRPEDVSIGQRIRQRRLTLGLKQQQVAELIGVKFQQLQKYESGMNRVSGSRLIDLSRALSVPPAFFLAGFENDDTANTEDEAQSFEERALLQYFRRSSTQAQTAVLEILKSTAQSANTQPIKENTNGNQDLND